jgi:hypothetical protein
LFHHPEQSPEPGRFPSQNQSLTHWISMNKKYNLNEYIRVT